MKNLFNSVKMTKPPRSKFDLSHDVKLSLNMGELIPIMVEEAIPGDKFNISCESLLRFAPMVAPVMHRMDVYMHYFFVPNRILWPNWEKFITNTEVSGSLPAFPTVNYYDGTYTRLHDYLGLPKPPSGSPNTENVSALAFAAYQCVYNEYYRDQNLINEVDYKLVDGGNTSNSELLILRRRAWEHDYFTSCLPFAQKGDPVTIPIDGLVTLDATAAPDAGRVVAASNQSTITSGDVISDAGTLKAPVVGVDVAAVYDPNGTLKVENANTTINDLRRAYRLQEWLEKSARGGSRYIENIRAMFGVSSSDKRLQRPEYITGIKAPVKISEVLNTTGTTEAPQGAMAGHGVSVTSGQYGSYYAEEHGYVIGIMSVMPKTAYSQGIPRHFLKFSDPFQYAWPTFANIGEQEVYNREIFAFQGNAGANTFGYIPRYAEYKFANNRVAGDMRDQLDFWHLSREFATAPSLNDTFIECNPTHRIFAVTDPDEQKLWAHVYNKVYASRLLPKYGTPTF